MVMLWSCHVSHSLNSLKGGYIGDYIGTTIGVIKGDTRSFFFFKIMAHVGFFVSTTAQPGP